MVLLPFLVFPQVQVQRAASPRWIEPVSYSEDIPDSLQSGGYSYLLFERQYNIPQQESYFRTATKVLTEKGLESASSISVNFDPSFQKLIFHSVIIKRGQKKIDKLLTNSFEILRREENMDRLVYDKSLDAILNLDDVQVGDIVEYSYTVHGYN